MSIPVIVQAYLDRLSLCFLDDDFEAWANAVELPFTLVSRTGTTQYETLDHLRDDFEEYVSLVGLYFITDIQRRVVSVDQITPLKLVAQYTTTMMSGSHQVVAPYKSTAMLQFLRGAWRATSIMGSIGKDAWTDDAQFEASNIVPFHTARARS